MKEYSLNYTLEPLLWVYPKPTLRAPEAIASHRVDHPDEGNDSGRFDLQKAWAPRLLPREPHAPYLRNIA